MSFPWIFAAVLGASLAGSHAAADAASGHDSGAPAASANDACPPPATWALPQAGSLQPASARDVIAAMAARDIVLLGERHDEADHHRWQVQVLAALHALRPRMAIGFEMFPRRLQPVLDRWVAGELTAKEFLERSEWDTVWNMPAELYFPVFHFARLNRIPMIALNVDQRLNKAITEKGWEAVPEAQREGVGQPAPPSQAYRDSLLEIFRLHGKLRGNDVSKANASDTAFRYFVQSQTVWDRAMAEALARFGADSSGQAKPLVVGVMGSGHIRHGHGVPHQLRDLGVTSVGTLIPLSVDEQCANIRAGYADAVFAVPKQASATPEPPRLGIVLEDAQDGIRISEVTPGSLAEKSGFKPGDIVVEIAGQPAKKIVQVVASVRMQPPGTWLPMRIRRAGEALDIVVKFPPRS